MDNGVEFTGLVERGEKAINERYRPMRFHEVIGNSSAKEALAKWMERGPKRSRSLFLNGASGTGKTTMARILAMGLNCEQGDTVNPCCECQSCLDAMSGRAMHISEYNMSALSRKEDADDIVMSMYNTAFTGRNGVAILDECLHYDARVECLVDGSRKSISIGEIVHGRMKVDVLSRNPNSGAVEPRPVVNWFRNPKKEVYEWLFQSDGGLLVLPCTDNHTVFRLPDFNEIQVGSLATGDRVAVLSSDGSVSECVFSGRTSVPKDNTHDNVYDIEVEGNHNYFASGINVHNCQGMSVGSQNLMLKMLEDPPDGMYVMICTTDPQKILKTVRSRCEQYEFRNPSTDDVKQMLACVVRNEMPSMPVQQRKEILEACKGLSFREMLMKLEKFIKGGGTGSVEEAFKPEYFDFAKAVADGDARRAFSLIDKAGDSFEIEAARRMARSMLSRRVREAPDQEAMNVIEAFRAMDRGFYTDPNPMPSFVADIREACLKARGIR